MLACKNLPRTKSAVHALLKLKANTNLVTNESCSALQWAAVHGDVEVVQILVKSAIQRLFHFRWSNGLCGQVRG